MMPTFRPPQLLGAAVFFAIAIPLRAQDVAQQGALKEILAKETFVRPSSAFGTLLQLASTDLQWAQPVMPDGAGVDDVLAGRIAWNDARPIWKEPA